jgi:hypothetical protein
MKYLIILILLLLSTKSNGQENCNCSTFINDFLPRYKEVPCYQDNLLLINQLSCVKENYYHILLSIDSNKIDTNKYRLFIGVYNSNAYDEINYKLQEINNLLDNTLSKVTALDIKYSNHEYNLYNPINFKFDNLNTITIEHEEYNLLKSIKKIDLRNLEAWKQFFNNHLNLTYVDIMNNFPVPLDLAKHIVETNKNIRVLSMLIIEANQDTILSNLIATHQTQLKSLFLYGAIGFLPSSFVNMQQLKSLELNDISDSLSFTYLKQLPKLEFISINLDLKKDYVTTLKHIATLENLEALSIVFNPETISTQIELPEELLALKKLKYLSITGLNICDKKNISSIRILQNLPNLTTLSVSCSNINLLNQEIAKEIAQLINQPMNNDKSDYNKYNAQLSIFFSKKISEKRAQGKKEMIMQYQKKYFMVNMIGVK